MKTKKEQLIEEILSKKTDKFNSLCRGDDCWLKCWVVPCG